MGEKELHNSTTDSRVDEILTGLAAGKRREQIAAELNYKNYKSLDIFMKRKNFEWDPKRNYYFPERDKPPIAEVLKKMNRPEGRVAQVLSLLKSGLDLKEIASQLKFYDHREMALFMKSKGYQWNEKESAYIYMEEKQSTPFESQTQHNDEGTTREPNEIMIDNTIGKGVNAMGVVMNEHSQQVISFLEIHKETLFELISSQMKMLQIPRYVVPGVCTTKSVHMNYGLDHLIREFSQEKNISQKDIVEVALIDFFKKYGFQSEVRTLVGQ
jgi:hypothetical protein